MAKFVLQQPKLLALLVSVATLHTGCVHSYADEYDCDEDLDGRPVSLGDLDATGVLSHPMAGYLGTLESPMSATAGPDHQILSTDGELQAGAGQAVTMTLTFGPEGTFYDGIGGLCDTRVAEFPVEVEVRNGEQLVFSGETLLGIVEPTFGQSSVRLQDAKDSGLLALVGISADEAQPSDSQERHAIVDVYAEDGEVRHVRLEVANFNETSGEATPLAEVLVEF